MKIEIDFDSKEILTDQGERIALYSDEGFTLIKNLWLRVGWNQKYNYTFTWFGVGSKFVAQNGVLADYSREVAVTST